MKIPVIKKSYSLSLFLPKLSLIKIDYQFIFNHNLLYNSINYYLFIKMHLNYRLAETKKEEGNKLYKQKKYNEALKQYSAAIGMSFHLFNQLFVK